MRTKTYGASLIMVIIFLALLGFAATFAVQVIPSYLKNMSIKNVLDGLPDNLSNENNNSTLSFADNIKRVLLANLRANSIYDIEPGDIHITSDGQGSAEVALDYEARKHLIANIDVLIHFENTVTVKVRAN